MSFQQSLQFWRHTHISIVRTSCETRTHARTVSFIERTNPYLWLEFLPHPFPQPSSCMARSRRRAHAMATNRNSISLIVLHAKALSVTYASRRNTPHDTWRNNGGGSGNQLSDLIFTSAPCGRYAGWWGSRLQACSAARGLPLTSSCVCRSTYISYAFSCWLTPHPPGPRIDYACAACLIDISLSTPLVDSRLCMFLNS